MLLRLEWQQLDYSVPDDAGSEGTLEGQGLEHLYFTPNTRPLFSLPVKESSSVLSCDISVNQQIHCHWLRGQERATVL